LKSQICNQFIDELVIGCDRGSLSTRASPDGQQKTDRKQYHGEQAEKRHSGVLLRVPRGAMKVPAGE
jgi:hypothetical protein